jgi:hypothetical protein
MCPQIPKVKTDVTEDCPALYKTTDFVDCRRVADPQNAIRARMKRQERADVKHRV